MRRPTLPLSLVALLVALGVVAGPAAADPWPTNTAAPVVSGSKVIGGTVTATTGTWTGTAPITYEYRWYRCPAAATTFIGCASIDPSLAWSTSNTYTTTAADVARRIDVQVRATNASGAVTAWGSAPYGPVHNACGMYCTTIDGTPGLKDYWRMDDPAGSGSGCGDPPMFDRKRDQVVGTSCTNPGGVQVAGNTPDDADKAMAFDSPSSPNAFGFTTTPDVALGGTNPWTFEFWIRPHVDYGIGPIFSVGNALTVTSYNYWGANGLGIKRADTYSDGTLCAGNGQWAHLAFTYDGTTVKAYCNGTVVNAITETTAVATPAMPVRFFPSNAAIDEFAVYDRALSASEVAAHIDARDRHAGPPVNKVKPVVSGTKNVGSTLTATTGTWDGTLPMTYQYRWYRCPAGATNQTGCSNPDPYSAWTSNTTYTTTNADIYRRIMVEVKATNSAGFAAVYSVPYGEATPVCGSYCTAVSATSGLKDYWSMDDPAVSGSGCGAQPMFDRKRGQVSGTSCNNPGSIQVPGATLDGTSLASAYDSPSTPNVFGFTTTPDVTLSGTSPWTFEFWIQPHVDYGIGEILWANTAVKLTSYNYWGANGLGLRRGDTYSDGTLCAGNGQWAHVALTYDGTTLKAYCNGLLANSVTDSTAATAWPSYRFFGANAAFDEFAAYDRALSQTEVQAHYAAR